MPSSWLWTGGGRLGEGLGADHVRVDCGGYVMEDLKPEYAEGEGRL